MTSYGMKTSNMVWTLGGAITTLAATRNLLGILGIGGGITRYMAAEGDNVGYYGHMNLDGYTALDSVEVDRSSMQPTQNYGAETIEQEMTQGLHKWKSHKKWLETTLTRSPRIRYGSW